MRFGLSVSTIGHATLILWGMISLPGASPYEMEKQEPLPVDILTIEEYTELTAGTRDGDAEAAPALPEPVEEARPSEQPTPKPEPERQQSTAPEPMPAAEPEPAPEPLRTAALPPDPEPAPAPEPEPVPQAAVEPEPEPAPQPTDVPLPTAKPRVAARPAPQPDPEPQRSAPQPAERDFNADRIAALLNKVPDAGGAPQMDLGEFAASLGAPTGTQASMSISEIDALRRQIARCWNPPIGVMDAGDLMVRIGLQLNPDGTLSAPPQLLNSSPDPVFGVAAEAAMRAISRCQPYGLPPEKYDLWREIHVNFDPKEILGG